MRFFYLIIFVFFLVAAAGAARASGNLSFDGKVSDRQRLLLESYLKGPATNPGIARADLNEDGLEEFIIRSGCKNTGQDVCTFKILGESGDKIVELASIEALALQLGNTYSGGVRSLVAFKNAVNDFKPTVYIWEPQAARYMMEN